MRHEKCVRLDMVEIRGMKLDTLVPASNQLSVAWSLLIAAEGQVRLIQQLCWLWLGGTATCTTATRTVWPLAGCKQLGHE